MRPVLQPGLLRVWRDHDTLQIGIDQRRAMALSGVRAAAGLFRLLDGSRDRARVIADAGALGIPVEVSERILTLLAAAGILADYPAAALRALPSELRACLLPELAAAAVAGEHSDGGAAVLARRAATCVLVLGQDPIAASLASLLTSAGLSCQAGTGPAGTTRGKPDLVVLTRPAAPELQAELHADGTAHLMVSAREGIGVVGPLVRPGRTACLRCLDLARAALDPAWPLILAQLSNAPPELPGAVLTSAVAAQAAAQAVAFADRHPAAGATEGGTLELVTPGWQWRRRSWRPHPACSCPAAVALTRPVTPAGAVTGGTPGS